MKKIILIALAITLIGFIPIIHQELTGCNTFGWQHLISPAVTSPDECSTLVLVIPLIPSVLVSLLFHSQSVYINYAFLGILSIGFYTTVGYAIARFRHHHSSSPQSL